MVRYRNASGEDRDRLRWVAIGLGSFLVSYALFWTSQNVPSAPAELSVWAQFVNVLPLTVLYAVVRHRVIDVRLAGGRAIAYAVLSAVPVDGLQHHRLGVEQPAGADALRGVRRGVRIDRVRVLGQRVAAPHRRPHRVAVLPRPPGRRRASARRRAAHRARHRADAARRDARARTVRSAGADVERALPPHRRSLRARRAARLARRRAAGDRCQRRPRAGARRDPRAGRRAQDRLGPGRRRGRAAPGARVSDPRAPRTRRAAAARREARRRAISMRSSEARCKRSSSRPR